MFQSEEKIKKDIITAEGEAEFQIRYMREENVGVLTSRSNKSYLVLDSIDYWYDLIQEKYPAKMKCQCKNDYFKLSFYYIPRVGTEDYRRIELVSCCTACGKQRNFAEIDIDYSPSSQLFEAPITYCEQPKLKYKTYSMKGYWKEEVFRGLIEFLSQKQLLMYCWYWNQTDKKRYVKQMTAEELKRFLFVEEERYLNIYFSAEALDELFAGSVSDDKGIYVDRDIWRKREMIVVNAPLLVAAVGAGYFYSMNFCSEYIDAGQVRAKSEGFCKLVREVVAYGRERLK
ncbi:MAG: hypothetical protein IJN16_05340 [Lachnospiraceae bacterium]|nr:hypothetical protein [Lachnospiraceae bacterium]